LDIEGWKIDLTKLPGPHHNKEFLHLLQHFIFKAPGNDMACLLYSVSEISLAWSVGLLAFYKNQVTPKLILCPKDFLCIAAEDTVIFSNFGLKVFIKKYVRFEKNLNRYEIPYCIIDFDEEKFTYIRLTNSSSYQIEELEPKKIALIAKGNVKGFDSLDGKVFDLDYMDWFGIKELNRFDKLYMEGP